MSSVWWVLWPLGGLRDGWVQTYPNILASVLCGVALWLWGRRHLKRLHRQHREIVAALGTRDEVRRGNGDH